MVHNSRKFDTGLSVNSHPQFITPPRYHTISTFDSSLVVHSSPLFNTSTRVTLTVRLTTDLWMEISTIIFEGCRGFTLTFRCFSLSVSLGCPCRILEQTIMRHGLWILLLGLCLMGFDTSQRCSFPQRSLRDERFRLA